MKQGNVKPKIIGLTPELFWAILSVTIGAIFYLGITIGKTLFDKEKIDYYEQNKILKFQIDTLKNRLDSIKNSKIKLPSTVFDVFINGTFTQGLNMGVNTSERKTDWVKILNNELCMNYPDGQAWGSVFITVGKPSSPATRAAKDFSEYDKLLLEMKGEQGSIVSIGLKDNLDPDDGNESKYVVTVSNDWNEYIINLREHFPSADLRKLYVVTEFVFAGTRQSVCVRKIQFIE